MRHAQSPKYPSSALQPSSVRIPEYPNTRATPCWRFWGGTMAAPWKATQLLPKFHPYRAYLVEVLFFPAHFVWKWKVTVGELFSPPPSKPESSTSPRRFNPQRCNAFVSFNWSSHPADRHPRFARPLPPSYMTPPSHIWPFGPKGRGKNVGLGISCRTAYMTPHIWPLGVQDPEGGQYKRDGRSYKGVGYLEPTGGACRHHPHNAPPGRCTRSRRSPPPLPLRPTRFPRGLFWGPKAPPPSRGRFQPGNLGFSSMTQWALNLGCYLCWLKLRCREWSGHSQHIH